MIFKNISLTIIIIIIIIIKNKTWQFGHFHINADCNLFFITSIRSLILYNQIYIKYYIIL